MSVRVPAIVGLYSDAPGCGKTTVADYLVRKFGYERISFAEPLKAMTYDFLVKWWEIDDKLAHSYVYGNAEQKERLIPEVGVTGRHLMQTLGTEWGRELIRDDLWVRLASERIHNAVHVRQVPVVMDDVRFPNEAAMLRDLGAELWRMERPSIGASTQGHASEGALSGLKPQRVIVNGRSIPILEEGVGGLLMNYSFSDLALMCLSRS